MKNFLAAAPVRALILGLMLVGAYELLLSIHYYWIALRSEETQWMVPFDYYGPGQIAHRCFLTMVFAAGLGMVMGSFLRKGRRWINGVALLVYSFGFPFLLVGLSERNINIITSSAALSFLTVQLIPVLMLTQLVGWLLAMLWQRVRENGKYVRLKTN